MEKSTPSPGIAWSQRGKGSCPQCGKSYSSRYKPPNCPDCGYELGGSYVPKKKPRLTVPKCTVVVRCGDVAIYSANTSTHDDRCVIIRENQLSICQHHTCKQQRAMFVNSQKVEQFECQHTKSVANCESPLSVFTQLVDLTSYPCDEATKNELKEVTDVAGGADYPIAVKVSPTMYYVFGKATTNNTAGYCHVYILDFDPLFTAGTSRTERIFLYVGDMIILP